MEKSLFSAFENGLLTAGGETADLGRVPWKTHKDLEGVFLKNVVTDDKNGGALTCHLVRIDPGKKIGIHAHPSSIELHEVIVGGELCATEQGDIAYEPGSMAVLPANSPHEVRAAESGLCLFAKFVTIPG